MIIVGEAPGRGSIYGFRGYFRDFIAEAVGCAPDELALLHYCTNLIPCYDPDRPWPRHAAARAAHEIIAAAQPPVDIVLLGRRVHRAFAFWMAKEVAFMQLDYYSAHVETGVTYHVVTHPSRRNRMWNDPAEQVKFKHYLRRLA